MKIYNAFSFLCALLWITVIVVVIATSFDIEPPKDAAALCAESDLLRKDIADLQIRLDTIEEEVALMERIYAVAECESGLRHEGCWGDNGRAYGILQFHEPTFDWLCELSGIKGDWMNREDQLRVGMWAFSHGYDYLWTCSKTVEGRAKSHDHNG